MTMASSFMVIIGFLSLANNKKYRYLALSSLLVLLTLLLLRGKSYYSIGIIPMLVAAGAIAIEKVVLSKSLRILLPVGMILCSLPFVPFGIPVYQEAGMVAYFEKLENKFGLILGRRFEDGSIHNLPQDYSDQLGWEELAAHTAKAYAQIVEPQKSMIYCENYGQAGAISVIGKKYQLPEPISFGDSFIYWIPRSFDEEVESFIYINDELGEDIQDLFQDIVIVGRVSNPNAREYGTTVYLCTNPRRKFSDFWATVLSRVLN